MIINFLEKDDASSILRQEDEFIKRLSPFDRASRLKTNKKVSKAEFLEYISKQVLDFNPFESSEIESIIENLQPLFDEYCLKFPKKINFVKTTGREEGNAAYCRGDAIILPQSLLIMAYQLVNVITHELFHVFSKNNLKKQEELYNSIGFYKCPELSFPDELDYKITNPDAPLNNYFIEIINEKRLVRLMPILFSNQPYNIYKDGEFFSYLQFKLLEVEVIDNQCNPVYENNKLKLIDAGKIPEYFQKIGMNTDYIIHPEEILADNFVLLINNSRYVKTPRILENMSRILKS